MKRIKRALSLLLAASIVLSHSYKAMAVTIPAETIVKKSEFRGVWIPTVYNIDWPAISTSLSADMQKQQYIEKIDKLKAAGMNAVIFQVRPMGDAFYQSSYAPWSAFLTGVQGTSPGYDPLKFALEEAHKRNIEFHAWFNPFRISDSSSFNIDNYINKLPVGSPLKSHKEWIVKYEGNGKTYYWLNPGIKEAREYVESTILEVVKNYDIDAVHIDDYYYPYPISGVEFPDQDQYALYGTGFANKGDWRRNNINSFISNLSTKIKSSKSYVKFGVSPFGIWKNGTNVGGSETSGLSSYDSLFTDSLKWVNSGWLDYIIPQIYWNFGYSAAAYEKLIDWWTAQVKGKNISLYIGHAAYKIGESTYGTAWTNSMEVPNQVNYSRQFNEIKGNSFYSSKDVLLNRLGILNNLKTDNYKYTALIPSMPWKDNKAPVSPALTSVKKGDNKLIIEWEDKSNGEASYFAVYKFLKGESVNTSDPSKIAAIITKGQINTYSFTDTNVDLTKIYNYVVTSVDRLHNESTASNTASSDGININAIRTDKPSPQKVYSSIIISTDISGGEDVQAKFSVYDGNSWRVLQDYSKSNICNWNPVRAGDYTLRVEAKTAASSGTADKVMDMPFRINGLYKIFVDPGHGGSDPGTTGASGRYEKVNNLTMGLITRDLLRAYGFDVQLSREGDTTVDLYSRAPMANTWQSNLFISIHQNAYSNSDVNGIETYSYPGSVKGAELAAKVHRRLIEGTGANDRKTKTDTFVVLAKTNMPAILVEAGFISNAEEEKKLNSDAYQNIIAASLLAGVMDYYGIYKEDINKDSIIDIKDLSTMAKNYNKKTDTSSDEKYMDINNDGLINIYDLVLVSKKL